MDLRHFTKSEITAL